MDLGSGRLESSSRIQQRDTGSDADTWPGQRRRSHKATSPKEGTSVDEEDLTESSDDDEREIHQLDDIA